jgi:streptogramin lyase
LEAQTNSNINDEFTITTFEAPKGGSFGWGDGKIWFLRKNELIRLEPTGDRPLSVPIEEIEVSSWIFGDGSIWILGKSKNFWGIHRVNPQTGKVVNTIALDHDKNQGLSYGYGAIWVWSSWVLGKEKPLLRIDPETNSVSKIALGNGFKGQLMISDGKVWLLGVEDGSVKCLDPSSNKVTDEFSIGRAHDNGILGILKGPFKEGSYSYGIGEGQLWVLDTQDANGARRVLSGYDLRTHERIAKLETDDAVWGPVIWNGYVWLSSRGDPRSGHYISRIDPRLKHTMGRIFIPAYAEDPEVTFLPPGIGMIDNSLWAVSGTWGDKKRSVIIRRIQPK